MLGRGSFSKQSQRKAIGAPVVPGSASLSMESLSAALHEGEITACQPMHGGSNYVYLVALKHDRTELLAVYKPRRGEWPLWDFPEGTLYRRERAAYLVSESLGWSLVPPTIIREGPYGIGMMQWFIETQPTDYGCIFRDHIAEFRRIAAFDWLTNNADRKRGHCLQAMDGRLWCIDHGLTFNAVPKLRTIVWDFSGEPVPGEILADFERLAGELSSPLRHSGESRNPGADRAGASAGGGDLVGELSRLLAPDEIDAFRARLASILRHPVYPESYGSHRRYPWPPY